MHLRLLSMLSIAQGLLELSFDPKLGARAQAARHRVTKSARLSFGTLKEGAPVPEPCQLWVLRAHRVIIVAPHAPILLVDVAVSPAEGSTLAAVAIVGQRPKAGLITVIGARPSLAAGRAGLVHHATARPLPQSTADKEGSVIKQSILTLSQKPPLPARRGPPMLQSGVAMYFCCLCLLTDSHVRGCDALDAAVCRVSSLCDASNSGSALTGDALHPPWNPTHVLRRGGTAVLDASVTEGFGFEIGL